MNIGIIGSSSISEKFCNAVIEQINLGVDISLTANYSRNLDNALAFAAKFSIEKSFDNKIEMFEEIDLVYIATPNRIHFDDVKLALLNDTHVIVEKPITVSKELTKQLFDLASERNLVLVEAIKTCSMNTYLDLVSNLNQLGNVQSFRFNMMRNYGNFPTNQTYPNIYRADMDGGVIADLGSYALFPLIDFVLPNYESSEIEFNAINLNYGLDVEVDTVIRVIANQIHGLITLSMRNQDNSLSYIYFEHGYVTIDSLSQFNKLSYYDNHDNLIRVVNRDDCHLMASELLHTLHLIEGGINQSEIMNSSKSILVSELIERLRA